MPARMTNEVQHYLNPRIRRVASGGYETRDGQFRIARAGRRREFTIEPCSEWADRMLICAGLDRSWRLKREALEHLRGSVYDEPDGWAHADPGHVDRAYEEALREPVEHR